MILPTLDYKFLTTGVYAYNLRKQDSAPTDAIRHKGRHQGNAPILSLLSGQVKFKSLNLKDFVQQGLGHGEDAQGANQVYCSV